MEQLNQSPPIIERRQIRRTLPKPR
jgi:hypothetical protein